MLNARAFRPFKMKYLTCALNELKHQSHTRISNYRRQACESDPSLPPLPQPLLDYFDGIPSKEQYTRYLKDLIKQEKEALKFSTMCYSVYVDYPLLTQTLRAFHESLAPASPSTFDWGLVTFQNNATLVFENLSVFRDEVCILETISHENMMTVRLEAKDLTFLETRKNGKRLVKKLRRLET